MNNTIPDKFHFLNVENADDSVLSVKDKIYQYKFNGASAEIFIGYDEYVGIHNNDVRIFGRGVLEYGITSEYTKRFPEIVNEIKRLNIPKRTNFVGELIVIDKERGFESLELVQKRTQRDRNVEIYAKTYPALLVILDVVEVEGKDVRNLSYLGRINSLKSSVDDWKSDIVYFVRNDSTLDWNFVKKNKLEGVVVRNLNATYNMGIWKIKLIYTEDVYCKGEYNPSDSGGGRKFASLICYQLDKEGNEVYVADVGMGLADSDIKEIQKIIDSGSMKEHPLVVEIKTLGRAIFSMKFRSPVFLRIRHDKPWRECVIKGQDN